MGYLYQVLKKASLHIKLLFYKKDYYIRAFMTKLKEKYFL
jgi:hypothetical protein